MEWQLGRPAPGWTALGRRLRRGLACAMALSVVATTALAGDDPAAHAPIGVMGDHTHEKNELMFSYRYMRMGMNGMRDRDERISASRVLQDFVVTPLSMEMDMHMFGAMYAPVDRVTLMLMVPYVEMEMRHRARPGARFTTYSDGIGDVRLSALVDLWKDAGEETEQSVHAQIGLSFPTGSITENDRTPLSMGNRVRLPYPMQIGSGTWDFLPALTYRGFQGRFGWGAQGRGEIRMNENHANYRQGNEYGLTAWGSYTVADWLSLSLRADFKHALNYRGRDSSIGTMAMGMPLVPTADPGRRTVMQLDALVGANFTVPFAEALHGLRFAVEAGIPAYQYLDGPGLETDYVVTVGVQYAID